MWIQKTAVSLTFFVFQCPWPFSRYSREEVTIREGPDTEQKKKRKREVVENGQSIVSPLPDHKRFKSRAPEVANITEVRRPWMLVWVSSSYRKKSTRGVVYNKSKGRGNRSQRQGRGSSLILSGSWIVVTEKTSKKFHNMPVRLFLVFTVLDLMRYG